jgi:chromosome segregation ATPase
VTTLLGRIEGGASLEEISVDGAIPLANNFTEDDTVELDELKKRVAELEAELATAKASLQEKEDAKAALETEKAGMETELAELRAFKKEIDDEVAKAEKIDGIKAKFAEAKLEKEDTYFTENSEKLLSLDEAALDFMIQELSAFSAQASQKPDEKEEEIKIPNFKNEGGELDIHAIVTALKERKTISK